MGQLKWIEQIRVRSSPPMLQKAMSSLFKQVKDIEMATFDVETFFVQHALYEGDLAVVLVWLNAVKPQKTHAGVMIAACMQELGPIDHAVWIPAGHIASAKP